MPGIQLYQTELDELVLVRAALESGCCIVPDVHLKIPEAQRIFDLSGYKEARAITRHSYILSSSFAQHSLSIEKVDKEKETFYYVSPGVAASSLEFLGGGIMIKPETDKRFIGSGFLEFSREYWSADLSRKLPAPPECEALFVKFSNVLTAHSFRIKPGKSVFRLGEDARTQLESGAKLVGYESWLPPASLSRRARL